MHTFIKILFADIRKINYEKPQNSCEEDENESSCEEDKNDHFTRNRDLIGTGSIKILDNPDL